MMDASVASFLQEEFDYLLEDNPEYASQCGFHEHAGKLQALTPASFQRRKEHNLSTASRARELMKVAGRSDVEMLHLQLLAVGQPPSLPPSTPSIPP